MLGAVSDRRDTESVFAVVCPHCRKKFEGALLTGGSARRGFKCPHCRLFVSYQRPEEEAQAERRA